VPIEFFNYRLKVITVLVRVWFIKRAYSFLRWLQTITSEIGNQAILKLIYTFLVNFFDEKISKVIVIV